MLRLLSTQTYTPVHGSPGLAFLHPAAVPVPVEPPKSYAEVLHEEEVAAMIDTRVTFFAVQKGGGAEVGASGMPPL
jgi:hypothetical protein